MDVFTAFLRKNDPIPYLEFRLIYVTHKELITCILHSDHTLEHWNPAICW